MTRGVYGGPSIHVAKGVTIRTGAFQAQSHEELKDIDQGTLALTTKRLAFAGSKSSVVVDLPKLISVDAYSDAVAIRRTGKERTEFLAGSRPALLRVHRGGSHAHGAVLRSHP